jgi:CBS domain-containing protein
MMPDTPNNLADTLARCPDLPGMAQQMTQHRRVLINSGDGGIALGQQLAAAADALTQRLVTMATTRLGTPPIGFAWVATGSQARGEMNMHSDQDNALILADDIAPRNDAYFRDLADFVNGGLDRCGVRYCPGQVMAKNPAWQQPLSIWREQFEHWLTGADRKRAMLAANFLDMRTVAGDDELCRALRSHVLPLAARQESFLAHLIHNAMDNRPPGGFFGSWLIGEPDTIDLKKSLVIPVVDLARIAAVGAGVDAVPTLSRLHRVGGSEWLSTAAANGLAEAFSLGFSLRSASQTGQTQNSAPLDHQVSMASLGHAQRAELERALSHVADVQAVFSARLSQLPL